MKLEETFVYVCTFCPMFMPNVSYNFSAKASSDVMHLLSFLNMYLVGKHSEVGQTEASLNGEYSKQHCRVLK